MREGAVSLHRFRARALPVVASMAALIGVVAVVNPTSGHAQPPIAVTASSVAGSDGTVVTATNHLVQTGHPTSGEYLVVWAGDEVSAARAQATAVPVAEER